MKRKTPGNLPRKAGGGPSWLIPRNDHSMSTFMRCKLVMEEKPGTVERKDAPGTPKHAGGTSVLPCSHSSSKTNISRGTMRSKMRAEQKRRSPRHGIRRHAGGYKESYPMLRRWPPG